MDFCWAHFSSSTKKMPFLYDLSECLNKLNLENFLALMETYLISWAEHTTSIGLYPRLVRKPLALLSALTKSLANLWLSPNF